MIILSDSASMQSHGSSGIQWIVPVGLISPANPDPSERRTRKCTRWVDPIARETLHLQCPESDEAATLNRAKGNIEAVWGR